MSERSTPATSACHQVAKVFEDWSHPSHIRLHAGEFSAEEMRSVLAVLAVVRLEVERAIQAPSTGGGNEHGMLAAQLRGIAEHLRSVPAYEKLRGDADIIERAMNVLHALATYAGPARGLGNPKMADAAIRERGPAPQSLSSSIGEASQPVCYAIVNAAGKIWLSESCIVEDDEGDLEAELGYAQESDPTFRVVPLYVAPSATTGSKRCTWKQVREWASRHGLNGMNDTDLKACFDDARSLPAASTRSDIK